LQVQEFLAGVRDELIVRFPDQLNAARPRLHYGMLQIDFGDRRVHYEVWLVRKTARIEIGLHFEANRDRTHAWAEPLAERSLELRHQLGPEAELEEWTPSWMRLHETLALEPLDTPLQDEVIRRMTALIGATGDFVAALPKERSRPIPDENAGRRAHWKRRRRQNAV
jgi:hypothetical protein